MLFCLFSPRSLSSFSPDCPPNTRMLRTNNHRGPQHHRKPARHTPFTPSVISSSERSTTRERQKHGRMEKKVPKTRTNTTQTHQLKRHDEPNEPSHTHSNQLNDPPPPPPISSAPPSSTANTLTAPKSSTATLINRRRSFTTKERPPTHPSPSGARGPRHPLVVQKHLQQICVSVELGHVRPSLLQHRQALSEQPLDLSKNIVMAVWGREGKGDIRAKRGGGGSEE